MADSPAFEAACAGLEQSGALDRLAARGTIRIVLKKAGLEPQTVMAHELGVVVAALLPAELSTRGVSEADSVCASIGRALERIENRPGPETPEAIFARLGR